MHQTSVENWIAVAATAVVAAALVTAMFVFVVGLRTAYEEDVSTQQTVSGVGYCTPGLAIVTVTVPVDCEAVCGTGGAQ